MIFRIERAEEFFGDTVAAAHAVEQPGGAELRAQARADVGDEDGEVDELEQEIAAGGLCDEWEGGGDFVRRKRLVAPHELCGVDFERSQHAGDEADQDGREHDIAAGIFDFFGEGGDGVEADVGEDGDGSSVENIFEAEGGGIVERVSEKSLAVFVNAPEKMDDEGEKDHDDDGHSGGHYVVDASRGFDAADIEKRESAGVEDRQRPIRQERKDILCELAADDGANQRIQDVIHHDGPAGDVAESGIEFLANIGVGRAGRRIRASHFSVADGGKEHGDHGNEDGGDDVAAGVVANYAVDAHGCDRLDDDDADNDQVPEGKDAAEFYCGLRGLGGLVGHGSSCDLFPAFQSLSRRFSVASGDRRVTRGALKKCAATKARSRATSKATARA